MPDLILKTADEVVNINLTADELIVRLKKGKIYDQSKIETALQNFFLPKHLLQLRELALREVAHQVERKIENEVFNNKKFIPDKIIACISTNDEGAKNVIRKTSIPLQYCERIFERFFKIPNDAQGNLGTGLGLAISKEFIAAQGGKIWVKEVANGGSKIVFQLPCIT